jgi:hypothetical protein
LVLLLALAAVFLPFQPGAAGAISPPRGLDADFGTALTKVQFWPFGRSEPRVRRPPPPPPPPPDPTARLPAASGEIAGSARAPVLGSVPATENTTRIAVFGDSMAVGLADALTDALTEDKGFQVLRMTKTSSGIVRDDYYNWGAELAAAIANERIDIAIWMIGINDRQPIREGGATHQPQTPGWTEIYKQRIDTFIKQLQARGAAVYWVGLPIMRSTSFSADIAQFNAFYRERAELLGARYVDIWDAFADASGNYSSDGPDLKGVGRRMRRSNGIHLTDRGNFKLAHFVQQAIEADLESAGTDASGRRVIRQGARGGLVMAPGASPMARNASELAGAEGSPIETGGLGGPAVALSTLGTAGKTDGEADVSPLFKVLMRGETLEPKPGRADDFRWPR